MISSLFHVFTREVVEAIQPKDLPRWFINTRVCFLSKTRDASPACNQSPLPLFFFLENLPSSREHHGRRVELETRGVSLHEISMGSGAPMLFCSLAAGNVIIASPFLRACHGRDGMTRLTTSTVHIPHPHTCTTAFRHISTSEEIEGVHRH
jgi:hypothetical protein